VEERLNYVEYAVPFKKAPPPGSAPVGACILGNMIRWGVTGDSVLLPKLAEMAESQTEPSIRLKYERTIEFLVKHERRPVEDDR